MANLTLKQKRIIVDLVTEAIQNENDPTLLDELFKIKKTLRRGHDDSTEVNDGT